MAKWSRHLALKGKFAGSSLRWVPQAASWPGHYINMRHCGGLSMVFLQLKDPLVLFDKEKGISSRFRFPSHPDMT